MTGLVSIGIPTYNRAADYLPQAIASVLRQTYQNFEIIVSDDSSPDNTEAIVRGFNDPRIRYHRPKERLRVPRNWNECARLARGEFFGILPDDDVYLPEFMARMVAALREDPDKGYAMCVAYSVDEILRPLAVNRLRPGKIALTGDEAVAFQVNERFPCIPVTMLFRRQIMVEAGLWREDYWDDWAFPVKFAHRHGLVFLPEPLTGNRNHEGNLSKVIQKPEKVDDVLNVINQVSDLFGSALPVTHRLLALRAECDLELSHMCMLKVFKSLLTGNFSDAWWHYRRANYLFPLAGLHPGYFNLWLRHRAYVRLRRRWKNGQRLAETPVIDL